MPWYELVVKYKDDDIVRHYLNLSGRLWKSNGPLKDVLAEMKTIDPISFDELRRDKDVHDFFVIRQFKADEIAGYVLREAGSEDNCVGQEFSVSYDVKKDILSSDGDITVWECLSKNDFMDGCSRIADKLNKRIYYDYVDDI